MRIHQILLLGITTGMFWAVCTLELQQKQEEIPQLCVLFIVNLYQTRGTQRGDSVIGNTKKCVCSEIQKSLLKNLKNVCSELYHAQNYEKHSVYLTRHDNTCALYL